MTLLPNSWAFVLLGEAGSWRGGGTPSKDVPEFWLNGDVPWVSPKDMKTELIQDSEDHITDSAIEQSATSRVPPESVLVVTRSGILARTLPVAVTRVEVTINQDLKALTPNRWIEARFVAWALRAFGSDILRRCKKDGTTVASIDSEALLRYQVPLAPQNEQRRVVEAIDSYLTRLDDAVASLGRVQAKLKAYRASVLKAAMEGRLVPTEASLARAEKRAYEPAEALLARILKERRDRWVETEPARFQAAGKTPKNDKWKAKYEEPVAPDMSRLPGLPEGWRWASLGLMKEFSLYGPRFSSDDYAEDGVLVLRTSDISESGRVDLATPPRLNLAANDFERYQAKRGDLLITRTGSLGTLAVLDDEVRAIAGAYLIQYRLAAPTETIWFCFYFLKCPRAQMQLVQGGRGVGRPNLNVPTIDSILIPLPPLAEQARIIDEIQRLTSVSDELAVQMTTDVQRAARLRQAVLKWAFEGKLVDQDPTDEPAEKVLARVRAERAADGPVKKNSGHKAQGAS